MRKIVIATHATFAKGIKEAIELIVGKQESIDVLCAYTTPDFNIEKEILNILKSLKKTDELIVLVDVFGGSVSNVFSNSLNDHRVHLITGVNFPMLLDIVLNQESDIQSVIKKGVESGKQGIVYVNLILKEKMINKEGDFDD